MKISINSPSYKRPQGIEVLNYLPNCMIWISENEFDDYAKVIGDKNLVVVDPKHQGNVSRIRNYILNMEFEKSVDAVCILDDDVNHIGYYKNKKRRILSSTDFLPWLIKYTEITRDIGAKLWGINLNQDKQSYREYTPFSLTSIVLGPFTVHLSNPIRYDENFPLKEDYDLSIQHLNKYRKILRLNKFFYIAKQGGSGSGQKGGCSSYRNLKRESEQIKKLIKKWGSHIVKYDFNPRSHSSKKIRKFDLNPVVKVPIRGI